MQHANRHIIAVSGLRQGDPEYESMVRTVHDATLAAGRRLGGPSAWRDRADLTFFQAPSEAAFVRLGVQRSLEGPGGGAAPIEGAER